ncbi:hypothetical protein WAI453_009331 [Rhynchosporium graminicola]
MSEATRIQERPQCQAYWNDIVRRYNISRHFSDSADSLFGQMLLHQLQNRLSVSKWYEIFGFRAGPDDTIPMSTVLISFAIFQGLVKNVAKHFILKRILWFQTSADEIAGMPTSAGFTGLVPRS